MAENHLTSAQNAAAIIIRKSADAVVAEACGTDVSDEEMDWEATTFARHKLPDFLRLEERQCALSMAGYIAERLYTGQPWQQEEAELRALAAKLTSSQAETEPHPGEEAAPALLIIRSYHPELSEDELIAVYRQHEQATHAWLQQIEVWTTVLEKARTLGLTQAGDDG